MKLSNTKTLFNKKILSPFQAQNLCKKLSERGTRIVFTNGCFDILHTGHVQYLAKARRKGDFLIVALDTDQAVRHLKGRDRPVNSLKDRMQVIAALECVDAVTWFEDADPLALIKKIRPRVLVKGGDWPIDKIRGSFEVQNWGGKVYSISFLSGRSTTNIIKKIRASS